MALLASARRASCLPVCQATALLRQRPRLSSARAISFWSSSSPSSSSTQDNEDPIVTALRSWASLRDKIDTVGAQLQELRLRGALGSWVQPCAPAADLPGLLAQIEARTDYFPFEISESKCGDTITLTRTLKGEKIKVVVSIPSLDDSNDEKENQSSLTSSDESTRVVVEEEEKEDNDTSRSTMHLEVTVTKGDGSNLQFACFANPDKVEIYNMYMAQLMTKEDGDDDHDMATYDGFDGLDENMQKYFHEYIEQRGVTPKMMNLLRGYLRGRLQRKHTLLLSNLKEFVRKK